MRLEVYAGVSKGDQFAIARQDLVTMLKDFQAQLVAQDVIPNVNDVLDNHSVLGTPTPFFSVGITNVTVGGGGDNGYFGRAGLLYDICLLIEMEIWLHMTPIDGQGDELLKWNLLSSLFNYLKDRATISSNFDAFYLRGFQGNISFGSLGTEGAVVSLTVKKVASR